MGSSAADWAPVAERLAAGARVLAYDRRGYGASGAPEPYERTTVEEQAEDAAALLRALDAAPALLCGTDIGALVCLDLLKRHPGLASGAVLVEPPLYAFVPDAAEALADERVGAGGRSARGRSRRGRADVAGGPGRPARARRPCAGHAAGVLRRLRRPGPLAGDASRAARDRRPARGPGGR